MKRGGWADNGAVSLTLPPRLVAALWRHAEREAPRECVGALGGRPMTAEALALYPLANVAPDPERTYLADPGHLLRALRAMEAGGLSLVALYHSHPRGPAMPSRTDRQLATYDVPYVIADLTARTLRAYRLPGGEAVPLLFREAGSVGG